MTLTLSIIGAYCFGVFCHAFGSWMDNRHSNAENEEQARLVEDLRVRLNAAYAKLEDIERQRRDEGEWASPNQQNLSYRCE